MGELQSTERRLLPAGRRLFLATGDFRFLLDFFVIMLFIPYSPYPYLASLSALLALPVCLFFIPFVSKKLSVVKSPLSRILLPFVLSSIAVCPLFVEMFRLNALNITLRILFPVIFLPLFYLFMSMIGHISGGIARALGHDFLYSTAKKGIRIISIVILSCLAYFLRDNSEWAACLVAIIAATGFLTQYLAVYDFSSRFKPEVEDTQSVEVSKCVQITAIFSIGIIAVNVAVYFLSSKGGLMYGVTVGGFALVISCVVHALKNSRYEFMLDRLVKISSLGGIFFSGLIVTISSSTGVIVTASIVSFALLVLATTLKIIELKKKQGVNHD